MKQSQADCRREPPPKHTQYVSQNNRKSAACPCSFSISFCFCRFKLNLWCLISSSFVYAILFSFAFFRLNSNSNKLHGKHRTISNKKSSRHRKWFLWTYHKNVWAFCVWCVAIQYVYSKYESKQQNSRHKTTTTKTAQKKYRILCGQKPLSACLFSNCSFLISLCVFGYILVFSCSSCSAVDATVEKGFFFCFVLFHGVAAHFALLQFKLLEHLPRAEFYEFIP